MKKYISEFLRRGFVAAGVGPIVLAVLYLILQNETGMESLSVNQVCLGIISLYALAFVAGGMNVVYQIEQLPLMVAVFIHGAALYIGYLVTYLINNWLEWKVMPILVFTGIFILGYLLIWLIIYSVTKRDTEKLNQIIVKNMEKRKYFICVDNDKVGAIRVIDYHTERNKKISPLFILPEYQNKGIGTALINEIKKIAKENKCDNINLSVWSFNENAIKFYKHAGFKNQKTNMEIVL